MRTGAEYRARPRELETGLPLSTRVSSNFPVDLTMASPWRIRFSWFGSNLGKEKERNSAESTLCRNKRKKATYMDRKTKNEFWVWKL